MFFFDGGGGRRLLGFFHPPIGVPRDFGLVYCHPFAEEKNQSHVVAARTARRLAESGTPVLRFDFSGCGDSEGELEDASADDWLGEIGRAADLLRAKTGLSRTGFWGLRSGANLAALHASTRNDVAMAMLWQPVPDLKSYIHQFLRQKLATGIAAGGEGGSVKELVKRIEEGEAVEVMGYPVRGPLYRSFASKTAGPAAGAYAFPVSLFAFTEEDSPPEWLVRMAASIKASNLPVPLVQVREQPFWDRYWRWDAPAAAESAAACVSSLA